jgi:hypothetical protein
VSKKKQNITVKTKTDDVKLKLTEKQARWLNFYIDSDNLNTFMNATASAKAANYNCSSYHSFCAVGQENLRKLEPLLSELLGDCGITRGTVKALLSESMRATKIILTDDGDEIVAPDHQSRVAALRLAGKFLGMEAPTKHEHSGVDGKDLEITVKPGMTPKEAVQECEAMLRES